MKDFNGIYTPAESLSGICPKPDQRGDLGSVFNGVEGMEKGTPGQVDEVTLANIPGPSTGLLSSPVKGIGSPQPSAPLKGV